MKSLSASDIADIPIQERIRLVEEIWDSIVDMADQVEVPEWHRKELDKRLAAYRENPDHNVSWDEIRKRLAS